MFLIVIFSQRIPGFSPEVQVLLPIQLSPQLIAQKLQTSQRLCLELQQRIKTVDLKREVLRQGVSPQLLVVVQTVPVDAVLTDDVSTSPDVNLSKPPGVVGEGADLVADLGVADLGVADLGVADLGVGVGVGVGVRAVALVGIGHPGHGEFLEELWLLSSYWHSVSA